jgi:hypothetical protein
MEKAEDQGSEQGTHHSEEESSQEEVIKVADLPQFRSRKNSRPIFLAVALFLLVVTGVVLLFTLTGCDKHNQEVSPNLRGSFPTTEGGTTTDDTMTDPTKAEWPELVGMQAGVAVDIIKQHRPDLRVETLYYKDLYTQDFDETRVRVFTDDNLLVSAQPHPPKIG